MKSLCTALFVLFLSTPVFTQSVIEELVKKGIEHHDKGEYDKAIDLYKKALDIDPKSTIANYEAAYSYFMKKDYKNAIRYSNVVIKQKSEWSTHAYVTKGSALDNMGKTKKSIKLFKKAIKETGGHYLLYYNLALNYFKLSEWADAELNILKALQFNPNHTSSHFMLAKINALLGNKTKSILAANYFLFLEPDSYRSRDALELLVTNFSGNVSKDEIWWNFYIPFFYDLAQSDHVETYCYYIIQNMNENAKKWLEQNEDRLSSFGTWLEK